ncbi:MAG: ankyrin repeat domain-containing protein [Myxococcales bacterium]|nr:ankyrin repeat domain-containing protein [Myxococcales bacterium]
MVKYIFFFVSFFCVFCVAGTKLVDNHTFEDFCENDLDNRLYQAVESNDYQEFSHLLSNGARPYTVYEDGISLLHVAAIYADSQIINELILMDLDINMESDEGETPLTYAITNFNRDAVLTLIENGASLLSVDEDGDSYLHIASMNNENAQRHVTDDLSILEIILRQLSGFIDIKNNEEKTPLDIARDHNNLEAVRILESWMLRLAD